RRPTRPRAGCPTPALLGRRRKGHGERGDGGRETPRWPMSWRCPAARTRVRSAGGAIDEDCGQMNDARKVAVLKGGRSLERKVSLRSGAHAQEALTRLGHEVIAFDMGPE